MATTKPSPSPPRSLHFNLLAPPWSSDERTRRMSETTQEPPEPPPPPDPPPVVSSPLRSCSLSSHLSLSSSPSLKPPHPTGVSNLTGSLHPSFLRRLHQPNRSLCLWLFSKLLSSCRRRDMNQDITPLLNSSYGLARTIISFSTFVTTTEIAIFTSSLWILVLLLASFDSTKTEYKPLSPIPPNLPPSSRSMTQRYHRLPALLTTSSPVTAPPRFGPKQFLHIWTQTTAASRYDSKIIRNPSHLSTVDDPTPVRTQRQFYTTLFCFENREAAAEDVVHRIFVEARSWENAQIPPLKRPANFYNINRLTSTNNSRSASSHSHSCCVDVAWQAATQSSIGWVISSPNEEIISQGSAGHSFVSSTLMAESLALKTAILAASLADIQHLQVFSDSLSRFSLLVSNRVVNELENGLLDIRHLLGTFPSILFLFISRSDNMIANGLAKEALCNVSKN